jgi:hypothetical protein
MSTVTTSVAAASPESGRFWRRLSLKPYGDELLTKSGDFWIFAARLIIFIMALAEAISWGYMGSLMSRINPVIAAAVAGTFIFTLIWIVDATFMTLDLSRAFYERALTGKEESAATEKLKLVGGVAARIGIVTASLFITAPFLAQVIFAGDVADEMNRRNSSAVATKRREIEKPHIERVNELQLRQKKLEEQRVKEAAGIGPSGKYGRGPVIETIERQMVDTATQIENAEVARASALSAYDRLSQKELEEKFGIRFLTSGVYSSGELLQELMKNPQFTGAELAVRAFLGFLFLGLMILKGFQPRSIAIYYNEQLHSIYDEYKKGIFDTYLPEPERVKEGGDIDPLRFEDWCLNTYAVIRKEDERRRETEREYRIHELLIKQWQRLEKTTRAELDPLMQRYDNTLDTIHDLEAQLHVARTSSETAMGERDRIEAAFNSMLQHIDKGGMDGPTFEQAMAAKKDLDDRRRALVATMKRDEGAVDSLTKRLDIRNNEVSTLREEIAMKQRVIADAEKRIGEERMKLAEIIAKQRKLWSGDA